MQSAILLHKKLLPSDGFSLEELSLNQVILYTYPSGSSIMCIQYETVVNILRCCALVLDFGAGVDNDDEATRFLLRHMHAQ